MAFLRIIPVIKQPVCLFAGQPEKITRSLAAFLPDEELETYYLPAEMTVTTGDSRSN